MDQNIFIRQDKAEHYEFQLEVNGLSADEIAVRFILHSDPFMLTIPCTRVKGDTWSVELPKMPFLEATTYQFVIEAIVEGHYFEAFRGSVTVTKSPEVYVRSNDAQIKLRNKEFTAAPTAKPATVPDETPTAKPAEEQPSSTTAASSVPEPSSDRFKEILDKIKNSSSNAEKEEKKDDSEENNKTAEQVVKDAEQKQEKEIQKDETDAVEKAEKEVDKTTNKEEKSKKDDKKTDKKNDNKSDKKDDKKDKKEPAKKDKKKTEKSDKSEKIKEILSNLDKTTIVAETEETTTSDPFANARKAADDLLSKKAKPAPDIQLENVAVPAKPASPDRDKVKELIDESRREREERKKREELRRQRLTEQYQQKQRKEEEAKKAAEQKRKEKEAADLEARRKEESERDLKAKQILESAKKQHTENDKPKVKFQKGETVVK